MSAAAASGALSFGPPRRKRRLVSLTPMIDVVFLLLIFFMLASRFSVEHVIAISAAGEGGGYRGAPRLVSVAADGVLLNGRPIALEALPDAVRALAPDEKAAVILRPADGADVQGVVTVIDTLRGAGFGNLLLLE